MKCAACGRGHHWDCCRKKWCTCGCSSEGALALKRSTGYELIETQAKRVVESILAEFGEIDLNEFPLEKEIANRASGEVARCAFRFAMCRFSNPEYV